jgi:hypothetical protein
MRAAAESGEPDAAFDVARVLHIGGEPRAAIGGYLRSLREAGPHPSTFLNLGTACYALGARHAAVRWLRAAAAAAAPLGR